TLDRVEQATETRKDSTASSSLDTFRQEMDDDFNTPKALAFIFDEVRSLNRLLDEKKTDAVGERGTALQTMCDVLGLLQDMPEVFFRHKKERWLRQQNMTEEDVVWLIAARNQARDDKNWQEADRLRNELHEKGIVLEDTPRRTVWKVK
ncbi:MAG: DALR domain-containing protein, partial [Candidatus Binatia bacterium]